MALDPRAKWRSEELQPIIDQRRVAYQGDAVSYVSQQEGETK